MRHGVRSGKKTVEIGERIYCCCCCCCCTLWGEFLRAPTGRFVRAVTERTFVGMPAAAEGDVGDVISYLLPR